MSNIYQIPKLISFNDIQKEIDHGHIECAVKGIIDISLYDENRACVQDFIGKTLMSCQNKIIKNACIKACGHIVRVDGFLNKEIIDFINSMKSDEYYSFAISDLKDDIEVYIKQESLQL